VCTGKSRGRGEESGRGSPRGSVGLKGKPKPQLIDLPDLRAIVMELWPSNPPHPDAVKAAHTAGNEVGDGWVSAASVRLLLRYTAFFARRWEVIINTITQKAVPSAARAGGAGKAGRSRIAPTHSAPAMSGGGDRSRDMFRLQAKLASGQETKRVAVVCSSRLPLMSRFKQDSRGAQAFYMRGDTLAVVRFSVSKNGEKILLTSTPPTFAAKEFDHMVRLASSRLEKGQAVGGRWQEVLDSSGSSSGDDEEQGVADEQPGDAAVIAAGGGWCGGIGSRARARRAKALRTRLASPC
jgi:hypothetical protein